MILDLTYRLLAFTIRKIGLFTLISLGLLAVLLVSLILPLSGIVRQLDSTQLFITGVIALLTGWAVARTRLHIFLSLPLGAATGILYLTLRIGGLGQEAIEVITSLNTITASLLRWVPTQDLPDLTPLSDALFNFLSGANVLYLRIGQWLERLMRGSALFDPAAASMAWALAIWLIAYWAGWCTRGLKQPLAAVLPAGVLLGSSLAVARGPWTSLLPLLAITLGLMGWTSYRSHEAGWEQRKVDFPEDIRFESSLAVFLVMLSLTLVAAVTPAISVRDVFDSINSLINPPPDQSAPVRESLGIERRPDPVAAGRRGGGAEPTGRGGVPAPAPQSRGALDALRTGGLPRDHLLGTGPELSEKIVMVISTGEFGPVPAEVVDQLAISRYYWRSITYDAYTGRGWITGRTIRVDVPAGQEVITNTVAARQVVHQNVRALQDLGGLLHVAGELVTVDQDFQVEWRVQPDPQRSFVGDLFGATGNTAEYSATSLYSNPSRTALRTAGEDYPGWVLEDFLELPDRLPDRVRNLAIELTATQPTPYDRAVAIENYLRDYPYNLDIEPPPGGEDVVDYFLFGLREGYCDYYASAMVVLARAAGLPARLAIGYATGSYDPQRAHYVVSEAEAHSWPEIFFPGYGWIAFEPTSSRPAFDRSEGEIPELPKEDIRAIDFDQFPRIRWQDLIWWTVTAGILLVFSLLIWSLADALRMLALPPGRVVVSLYNQLHKNAAKLQVPFYPGDTPYEFASAFAARMKTLLPRLYMKDWIFPASEEANRIADIYAKAVYSPRPPKPEDKRAAVSAWFRLRWRLLLSRIQPAVVVKSKVE
jgi:transglutaminase-like putative cysteine protease